MLPGETIATGAAAKCPDCEVVLVPKIMRSAAGHYIGTACNCGPYSRESTYFKNLLDAEKALERGGYERG